MKAAEILERYPDEALERLAADKLDEIVNLKFPRDVLIDEIVSALGSLSYVAATLSIARPPTYAFLKLLLDSDAREILVVGSKHAVEEATARFAEQAASGKALASGKNFELYLSVLASAWEHEGGIDRSEGLLLATLRQALGIWTREHLLLEHHPEVASTWTSTSAFEDARNHLLATGIVLSFDGKYVLADEVCEQIRRFWEIDLEDAPYLRLLQRLTGEQLRNALDELNLPLSGSKDERCSRFVEAMVPPPLVLDTLHIRDVKDLCRSLSLPVSGAKADLISNVIEHFDAGDDLREEEPKRPAVIEPEPRELEQDAWSTVLGLFSLDELHDILSGLDLAKYGAKPDRRKRILESPYGERTVLQKLRRADLQAHCSKLGLRVSGVKADLIDRLLEWGETGAQPNQAEADAVAALSDELLVEEPAIDAETVVAQEGSEVPTADAVAPASPPAGLESVKSDFPNFAPDEQTVLALLREAKSLNESDLERAAKRHNLGWFLIKAHMADLLARLAKEGRNPVTIRSTGSMNIYEWHGDRPATQERLDKDAARDVIDALRQGVVPQRNLEMLMVGQVAARKHLVELLDHVQARKSEFKFLRGAYGSGKSFTTSWLRERALERGFAVSTIKIGPDQPISELEVFFAGLATGLRTPEKRDASALADVLEYWLLAMHNKTAQIEGISGGSKNEQEQLSELVRTRIERELEEVGRHDPGFAAATQAFYTARLAGDRGLANDALSWLSGRSVRSASGLSAIGVRGSLEADQVFPRLRALLRVIEQGRLNGLVLVVDEVELVRRFPQQRQRERSYETIRLLIDEVGENRLPGCFMVFTGTDELFDDKRYGLRSYEALANRVSLPDPMEKVVSMRQPVIELERLDREGLLSVAHRVREIHGKAYNWDAIGKLSNEHLASMVDNMATFENENIERLPRPFLRRVVNYLDVLEENPSVAASAFFDRVDSVAG